MDSTPPTPSPSPCVCSASSPTRDRRRGHLPRGKVLPGSKRRIIESADSPLIVPITLHGDAEVQSVRVGREIRAVNISAFRRRSHPSANPNRGLGAGLDGLPRHHRTQDLVASSPPEVAITPGLYPRRQQGHRGATPHRLHDDDGRHNGHTIEPPSASISMPGGHDPTAFPSRARLTLPPRGRVNRVMMH